MSNRWIRCLLKNWLDLMGWLRRLELTWLIWRKLLRVKFYCLSSWRTLWILFLTVKYQLLGLKLVILHWSLLEDILKIWLIGWSSSRLGLTHRFLSTSGSTSSSSLMVSWLVHLRTMLERWRFQSIPWVWTLKWSTTSRILKSYPLHQKVSTSMECIWRDASGTRLIVCLGSLIQRFFTLLWLWCGSSLL